MLIYKRKGTMIKYLLSVPHKSAGSMISVVRSASTIDIPGEGGDNHLINIGGNSHRMF